MSDLSKRLRGLARSAQGFAMDADYEHEVDAWRAAETALHEAADELDRLRAALARTEANRDAAMQDATEEHERAERLRAENERLRAALETIADYADALSAEYIAYGGESGHAKTAKLARAALQETEE